LSSALNKCDYITRYHFRLGTPLSHENNTFNLQKVKLNLTEYEFHKKDLNKKYTIQKRLSFFDIST